MIETRQTLNGVVERVLGAIVGPSGIELEGLMDPTVVARALEMGEARAEHDDADLHTFWNWCTVATVRQTEE